MFAQVFNKDCSKYNIVILAGGAGSRMGIASDFIPKALTKINEKRAIDFIMHRYINIAHKFVIGIGNHADLLKNYVCGVYKGENIVFSYEDPSKMKNDGISLAYCLDNVDSRYGTIITYCDMLLIGNCMVSGDMLFIANKNTTGILGTFRNSFLHDKIFENDPPVFLNESNNGIIGVFAIKNTTELKSITYSKFSYINDLTRDIIAPYFSIHKPNIEEVDILLDFGTENELLKSREYWEKCK